MLGIQHVDGTAVSMLAGAVGMGMSVCMCAAFLFFQREVPSVLGHGHLEHAVLRLRHHASAGAVTVHARVQFVAVASVPLQYIVLVRSRYRLHKRALSALAALVGRSAIELFSGVDFDVAVLSRPSGVALAVPLLGAELAST